MIEQWEIRTRILEPIARANVGIIEQYPRWFPDHPAMRLDTYWEDPFPEEDLAYNKIKSHLMSPMGAEGRRSPSLIQQILLTSLMNANNE